MGILAYKSFLRPAIWRGVVLLVHMLFMSLIIYGVYECVRSLAISKLGHRPYLRTWTWELPPRIRLHLAMQVLDVSVSEPREPVTGSLLEPGIEYLTACFALMFLS